MFATLNETLIIKKRKENKAFKNKTVPCEFLNFVILNNFQRL